MSEAADLDSRGDLRQRPRVVVVGAGVTGLAVAYRLLTGPGGGDLDVAVLEASGRAGGKMMTVEVGGMPQEGGADSFVVRKPWAVDLCRDLDLESELVHPGASGAFILARECLIPYPEHAAFGIPSDVDTLLRWPGLSLRGRLRAATDLYRKPRSREQGDEDESIGDLVDRRLGPECTDVLVGPLLAGIHAGDAHRMSVRATFPELAEWERGHGSLIRGSRAARRAARETGGGAIFASVRGGLGRLTECLAKAVGRERIRLSAPCNALRRSPGKGAWEVLVGDGLLRADAVVITTPAFEAARLVRDASARAAGLLSSIPYVSTATVGLVYPEGTASSLPDATGFVVPPNRAGRHGPPRAVTACTWVSRKWPEPRFGDRAVVRAFVGRSGDESWLELDDEELAAAVARDIEDLAPVGAEPESWSIVRWDEAMPQYEVGHLDRVGAATEALAADAFGLFVAGSAYRGVGIADCVRQAEDVATQVRDRFSAGTDGRGRDRTEAIPWAK